MSAKNVQFSVAVHLMAALGFYEGKEIRSDMLACSVKADASFVRKTLSKLAKAGLIATTRGRHGACSLARPSEDISLLDIYRASDAPAAFSIHDYPGETPCPVSPRIKPYLTDLLDKVEATVEHVLSQIPLTKVVAQIRAGRA